MYTSMHVFCKISKTLGVFLGIIPTTNFFPFFPISQIFFRIFLPTDMLIYWHTDSGEIIEPFLPKGRVQQIVWFVGSTKQLLCSSFPISCFFFLNFFRAWCLFSFFKLNYLVNKWTSFSKTCISFNHSCYPVNLLFIRVS